MSELEQLRQEAEQLKSQIRVSMAWSHHEEQRWVGLNVSKILYVLDFKIIFVLIGRVA